MRGRPLYRPATHLHVFCSVSVLHKKDIRKVDLAEDPLGFHDPIGVFRRKTVNKNAYYALGDAIVVGIANNQSPKTPIDLTFTFADGSSCTFYFVQENTVRISGQNYVLEDGGKLWRLLADVSESAETESEVTAETESEAITEAE